MTSLRSGKAPAWVLFAAAVWFAVVFVGLYVTGLAGHRFGWLYASLVYAVPFILVARRRYGIALIAIAIIAGVITAHYAMPMPDRLRVTLDEITDSDRLIPGTMVFESGGGNALCFDICPHVQRIYRVERQDLARTEALLRDRLVELGYRQAIPGGTWTAGALQVSIDQEEADEFSGPVLIVGVEITD
jgi:hypothetical protein